MGGIEPQHQTVEEPAAPRGTFVEQPIHRWRQPHQAHHLGQRRLRLGRLAGDPYYAPLGPGLAPGADVEHAAGQLQPRADRPGHACGRFAPRHLFQPCAPQAAARRQKRQGLEDIGLAGAVRSRQHHRPGIDLEPQRPIGAELFEHQADDRDLMAHRILRHLVSRFESSLELVGALHELSDRFGH
jgi:hypothetical protein